MVSATKSFALRARMPVASVWHPYHFQVPTVAGWVGPVGVALADVLELVDDDEEDNEEVAVELVEELVAPEQGVLPLNVPQVPAN